MGFWRKLFGGTKKTEVKDEQWIDDDPVVKKAPVAESASEVKSSAPKAETTAKPVTRKAPGKVVKANKCGATTAAGAPCKSNAKDGSKFCGRHQGFKAGAKTAAKAPAKKAAAKPAAKKAPAKKVAAKADLNPQCAAVTAAGDQCKRSSRDGSKYCGAHKGYHPKGAAAVAGAKDTAPRHTGAKDTKPAVRKASKAAPKANAQCAALTASGSQCKSVSKDGSKYCGRHKGYRAPAKAAKPAAKKAAAKPAAKKAPAKKPAAKKAAAKPAAKKAPAKKPAAKKTASKTQVSEGDYKLFQNGNRFYFSKQSQADAKKKGGEPVYTMPAGRKVVKTANGLPVLKKA